MFPMRLASHVSAVGIVTRDRHESLAACLATYLANCRRHSRAPEFIVVDGSARENSGVRTRAALAGSLQARDSKVRYAGREEKRRFADALTLASGVDAEIVNFALFGDDRCARLTGANRNSLLLDTAGSLVFSADDDTVCRTSVAPEMRDSVTFTTAYDPTEFWFFAGREELLAASQEAPMDLLAGHERFLGRGLEHLGGEVPPTGTVTITLQGLAGDSGMGSPRYLLTLAGASRTRLLASTGTYSSGLTNRDVIRVVQQPTIAATPFCMTPFYGFDNRRVLPPFFPVERNSDGVWGLTLHHCLKDSHVAFLPWTLLHAPPEHRAFALDDAWKEAAGIRIADILIAATLAHNAAGTVDGDEARLTRLGGYFRELGALEAGEFAAFVRTVQQMRTLAATTQMETRLREFDGAPAFWADDVRRMIATLRDASMRSDYIVPTDLREGRDAEETAGLTRELVARYGALLECWPALVESARHLRARECRISELL